MKSVFLVKTPLQLLNAIEARHHYRLHKDDCVLILMADRKSQAQLRNLANVVEEWGYVADLNHVPLLFSKPLRKQGATGLLDKFWKFKLFSKSLFYVPRLNRIRRQLGEVNYFFVGYARYSYMKHLVNITPHKCVVALDDGNATIQLVKERNDATVNISNNTFSKRIKSYLKQHVQAIKLDDYKRLEFFTIYDVEPGERDTVVKNSFSYLHDKSASLEVTKKVYFIGSPIAETGILAQYEYLDHLKRVKSYYKGKELVYITHRREKPENLSAIYEKLGLNVVQFDYPIEYQLAVIGPRPLIIASFISSALDSCGLIFGDTMQIVSFKLDLSNSPDRERIELIYQTYKSNKNGNIKVEENY